MEYHENTEKKRHVVERRYNDKTKSVKKYKNEKDVGDMRRRCAIAIWNM